ncbi:MAG: hypothetical protein IT260_08810 [Saprospiraceae bacterium]|nr:hypothetical protein [Saprospiraceae bacterium]
MKDKNALHDELNELSPLLKRFKEQNDGAQVPPGYFDQLEDDVFRQLDAIGARHKPPVFAAQQQQRSWWQRLQSWWQPRLAVAFAGVLVLALAGWWYVQPAANPQPGDLAGLELSAEDAEAYLLDNVLELEPAQLALALPSEEWPAIRLESEPSSPQNTAPAVHEIQIHPDDLEDVLNDMSDEELKELLNG